MKSVWKWLLKYGHTKCAFVADIVKFCGFICKILKWNKHRKKIMLLIISFTIPLVNQAFAAFPHYFVNPCFPFFSSRSINCMRKLIRLKKLSNFKHGTIIRFHLCQMSVSGVSALLDLPGFSISAIIKKWMLLGAITA